VWPEELAALAGRGESLTGMARVGPWIAAQVRAWLDDPPEVPDPPELRSGFMTVAEARRVLDHDPTWRTEVRGDLQMHTTWSDGKVPLDEMAQLVAHLGYEFAAITDHSQGLRIARGMDEETLLRQQVEIERVNGELAASGARLQLLRSLEMNLSTEGGGDMDPAVLSRLDLVLGAFHSALRRTEDQTERYLAAVRNPTVHILGHPRGRRWNRRAGLRADWTRVFDAAARAGCALEIDAHPHRQDLQVELLETARDSGAWISIGTDAHWPNELEHLEIGLAAAARAGVPRERILNFQSRQTVLEWAAR
jgi:histidinol phosphatase-like PHP family hydrolase